MDAVAGLFSLRSMRDGCACNFLSSLAVRARSPPIPAARKESCEVLCSGGKNQIKILNLSERVLINKAIYYPSVHKRQKGPGLFTRERGAGLFWGCRAPPPNPAHCDWANPSAGGLMGSTRLSCRVFSVSGGLRRAFFTSARCRLGSFKRKPTDVRSISLNKSALDASGH